MNPKEMQMWKCDYKVPCHVASCHGRAAWFVGKPEKRYDALILCNKCARELVNNIPDELKSSSNYEVIDSEGNTIDKNNQKGTTNDFYNELPSDLTELTVKELKEIAKEKGIKGYYKMKEEELVKAIEGANP